MMVIRTKIDLPKIGRCVAFPMGCNQRQINYDLTMQRFLRGFDTMHGKLHGLSKKVLKFSMIIAYCQIFGIVRKFWHLGFQVPPGLPVWKSRKFNENCVSVRGALCVELAEFRCKGCVLFHCCVRLHTALSWNRGKFS